MSPADSGGAKRRFPSAPPTRHETPSGVFCFDQDMRGKSPTKTFIVKTLRSRPQFQYADPADQHEIWGPTLTP